MNKKKCIKWCYKSLKNVITLTVGLLVSPILFAQTSISSQFYLQNQLTQIIDNQRTISSNKFKSPFLDEINVRTETDEFRFNEQRYQIRFSPTSRKIRRAEEQLYDLYLADANAELREEYQPLILAAYETILDKYKTYRKLEIAEQQLITQTERSKVLSKLLLAGEGTPRDYLQMEREQQELAIKVAERRAELAAATTVDWKDWLSVEAIMLRLTGMERSFVAPNTADSIALALVDTEMTLENAERNRWFDFLGFEYNNSPEDPLREQASINASFNLPLYGQRKLKLEELKIEKEHLAATQAIRANRQRAELTDLLNKIKAKFQRWQSLTALAAELEQQLDDFIQRAQQSETASPLLELEERAARLDAADERLELELEIYELYLEYLEESGWLFQSQTGSYFH